MRRTIAALVVAVLVAHAAPAIAKASAPAVPAAESPKGSEEASERFRRGVTLYRERSLDPALAEFNRAYELAPDYRVLYNIGQVQAERGDYVAAVRAFRQYLKDGAEAVQEQRLSEVQAEIARLDGRIAKLTVTVDVDGAELVIDGELAGTLPLATVPVNAGIRRIAVRKKGFETQEQRLTLTGGEGKAIEVKLVREAETSAVTRKPAAAAAFNVGAPNDPERDSGSRTNTAFWISLAATGIAGGATTVFALLTNQAKTDFEGQLDRYPGSAQAIRDARSELKRDALITDVCGGLTIIGVGTTVYFAIAGAGRGTNAQEEPAKLAKMSLQTGPVRLSAHSLGWQVNGQF